MAKGYSLSTIWVAALGFVIATMVLAIGANIVGEMNTQTNSTDAQAVISKGLEALQSLANWLPMVAMAVAGVIVLMIIIRSFSGARVAE